ncbi:uncharacterized protein F4817DRAFT_182936 [Daldinia loculata]|uniref:uncharacterized protein n=1 Tax=Daldinia loculata TaxID=103429 RepID=UPI0020C5381A|nr:uncharacterized protein F4817DRAFT_182936 [Daldinia loculata]KAI1645336.1 hypothetical protein F4817DRAFT_182936 [Daldinia loculata]
MRASNICPFWLLSACALSVTFVIPSQQPFISYHPFFSQSSQSYSILHFSIPFFGTLFSSLVSYDPFRLSHSFSRSLLNKSKDPNYPDLG